ncbi:MAG: cold shock domain-containing protein [Candidatus Niyogibacteria bacterium]|nr:cold shock domain-containing protein [Candidatus Niyogibacteria bacterium]
MDIPTGFSVAAFAGDDSRDGLERDPADGYLGHLQEQRAIIEVRVESLDIIGMDVDHQNNVRAKKNWSEGIGIKIYRQKVPFGTSKNGWLYAPHPGNKLQLLEVDERGRLVRWEVALVSQNGEFFLTTQKARDMACGWDGDAFLCGALEKSWPQLYDFVVDFLSGRYDLFARLPDIQEYLDAVGKESELPDASRFIFISHTGYVLWYNLANGLGAILTADGEARVHWTQIAPRERFAYLEKGEMVSFQGLRKPDTGGSRSTSFKHEAVGVTALL